MTAAIGAKMAAATPGLPSFVFLHGKPVQHWKRNTVCEYLGEVSCFSQLPSQGAVLSASCIDALFDLCDIIRQSDGYLSWLLVHADNIDPELEFNPNESLIGEKTPGITSTATITNGDGMAENVGSGDEGIFTSPKQDEFDQSVVAISEPVLRVNAPESNGSAQGITTLRPAPQQELEQQMPFVRESPAQPRDRDAPSLTVAPNSTIVPSLKKAVDLTGSHPWTGANGPGGFGTSAADCDLPSSGATNDSACAAALLLQGQLAAAGGIPSDPVLAMQMGARMALAGEAVLERLSNRGNS